MILWRLTDRLLGLVSTLVLARLLVPADFGLIAMAMTFIALIELAGAFSFEVALIQRAQLDREHYDTAWTLNFGFAMFCGAATAALAPLAARFYSEPRLVPVMLILAVGWIVQGTENIGTVNFRRRMDFLSEFKLMSAKRVAGFVVTIVLAITLETYWALIAGQLTSRVVGVLASYRMEPYRPRFSLAARKDLFSFSSWMLILNVMSFGLTRLPHFLVGRIDGPSGLGLYTVASEIARLPSTELSAPINRAVMPGLSRLADQPQAFSRLFTDVLGTCIVMTLPAGVGLAIVSGLVIAVALGPQWTSATPILAVLAASGAIEAIAANSGVAYLALGKPRFPAIISAVKLVALGVLVSFLVPRYGVLGMAFSELIASLATCVVSLSVMVRLLRIPVRDLLGAVWRPLAACSIMIACLLTMDAMRHAAGSELLALLRAVGVGAVSYLLSLALLWFAAGRPAGVEATVIAHSSQLLARLRSRR